MLTVKTSCWGKNKAYHWVTHLMNNVNHWVTQLMNNANHWVTHLLSKATYWVAKLMKKGGTFNEQTLNTRQHS